VEEAKRVLEPLTQIPGGPAVTLVAEIPYLGAQQLIANGNPPGNRHYWKADLIDELTDEAIDAAAEMAMRVPSPFTTVLFQPLGGAVARVPADATALGRRDAGWAYHALGQWEHPDQDAMNIAWTREFASKLAPYSSGGVYITYTIDDDDDRMRDAFRGHYDRLVRAQ